MMSLLVARAERASRTLARGVLAAALTAVLVTLQAGGCAPVSGRAALSQRVETPASADRGRFYALRSCAGCHAVGDAGASPDSHAPLFRNLDDRVAKSDLPQRLADLSRGGHREMPPIYMSPDEITDLVAYITTLKRAPPRPAPVRAGRA